MVRHAAGNDSRAARRLTHDGRARLHAAVAALLRHFRRQRPLRAGSLIISIFGDSIAPRGGSTSLASLITLAQPFGLTERLVRTSVARLAKDGWLVAERRGRLSFYQLARHGRARFEEATRRIYGENPQSWNGRWTLVLLPREGKRVRDEMLWLGFGQLAPGVLTHPDREPDATRRLLRELGLARGATVFRAATGDAQEDRRIAAASWDLSELSRRYRRFVELFSPVSAALGGPNGLARLHASGSGNHGPPQATGQERRVPGGPLSEHAAFIVRTLLIHEYRKIHLRDPLLPASLLPADWVGAAAYELCRGLYAQVFAAADRHLSRQVTTARGRLAPPSESVFRRFGGLPTSSAAR